MWFALALLALAPDDPPLVWTPSPTIVAEAESTELQVALLDSDGELLTEGWSVFARQTVDRRSKFIEDHVSERTGQSVLRLRSGAASLCVRSPRGVASKPLQLELLDQRRHSIVMQLWSPDPSRSVYAQLPLASLELLGADGALFAVGRGRRVPMTPLEGDPRIWTASKLELGEYTFELEAPHLELHQPVSCSTGESALVAIVGAASIELVLPEGARAPEVVRGFRHRPLSRAWARTGQVVAAAFERGAALRRLAAGDYTLIVQHACGTVESIEVSALGPEERRKIRVPSPELRDLTVELVTSEGGLLPHEPTSLSTAQESVLGAEELQAYLTGRFGDAIDLTPTRKLTGITGEDGRATFRDLGPGPFVVEVAPEPWFSASLRISPAKDGEVVRAELPPSRDLELVLEGVEGSQLEDAFVLVAPVGGEISTDSMRPFDADGRCRLPLLPHGQVQLYVGRSATDAQEVLAFETLVVDDDTPREFRLQVDSDG